MTSGDRIGYWVVVGECKLRDCQKWTNGFILVCRCCGRSFAVRKSRVRARLRNDRCQACRGTCWQHPNRLDNVAGQWDGQGMRYPMMRQQTSQAAPSGPSRRRYRTRSALPRGSG